MDSTLTNLSWAADASVSPGVFLTEESLDSPTVGAEGEVAQAPQPPAPLAPPAAFVPSGEAAPAEQIRP
jgi:hypothetical protein